MKPEDDANPKSTLRSMIAESSIRYTGWNTTIASEIAEYLKPNAITKKCPKGFAPFHKEVKKR